MPSVTKIKYETEIKSPIKRYWHNWTYYFDNRIMTGKFFSDIYFVFKLLAKKIFKILAYITIIIYRSKPAQDILAFLRILADKLLVISVINYLVYICVDGYKLWKRFYGELLAIFTIAVITAVILIAFFTSRELLFYILALPLGLINFFLSSVIMNYIYRHEKNQPIHFFQMLKTTARQIFSLSSMYFLFIFSAIELILLFLITSIVLGNFLGVLGVDWQGSFLFWLIVVVLGLSTLTLLFLLTLVSPQAYYLLLLEKKQFFDSIRGSIMMTRINSPQFLIVYFLLFIYFIPITFWLTINLFENGFAFSMLLLIQTVLFSGFILHKKFMGNLPTNIPLTYNTVIKRLFTLIMLLGIPAYIFFSILVTDAYPKIIQSILAQQEQAAFTKQFITYQNSQYGYTINYPTSWSVYTFTANSVTIFDNYNNTKSGGINVTISVLPLEQSNYLDLVRSKPGLVTYDPATEDSLTKISAITVDNLNGIKYLYVKHADPNYPDQLNEYQTHYLLKKDNLVYDISFVTRSQDAENFNSDLFDTIANSFRLANGGK